MITCQSTPFFSLLFPSYSFPLLISSLLKILTTLRVQAQGLASNPFSTQTSSCRRIFAIAIVFVVVWSATSLSFIWCISCRGCAALFLNGVPTLAHGQGLLLLLLDHSILVSLSHLLQTRRLFRCTLDLLRWRCNAGRLGQGVLNLHSAVI
jgi:hypothetical protein